MGFTCNVFYIYIYNRLDMNLFINISLVKKWKKLQHLLFIKWLPIHYDSYLLNDFFFKTNYNI